MKRTIRVLAAVIVFASACDSAWASYCIYIGKNLTVDGSVFLAGYGDEPSSHRLEIVPARQWSPGATIKVGATAASQYPGALIEIPQVPSTAKYITMNYSSFAGFPPPITNGGLNQHLVAARDVWSPSREELRKMTPNPQRGLNYSDLSRIVMERARTAREAVEIVGELVNKYGYATYGGNSHLFADADEGWVLWPTPYRATNRVYRGGAHLSRVVLPVVAKSTVAPPEFLPPPNLHRLVTSSGGLPPIQQVLYDQITNVATVLNRTGGGTTVLDEQLGSVTSQSEFRCSASVDNPAQASIVGKHRMAFRREDGDIEVTAESTIRSTETHFHVTINIHVTRNGLPFFQKQWLHTEPRRLL